MKSQSLKKFNLPDSSGVYFFLGKNKQILYIGRATSLRDRVRNYFSSDLMDMRGPKIVKMIEEATSLDFKEADSVLEAILLEADLIKKFKPPYNTDDKDDKSFNCVVITKEDFPRVLMVRQRDLLSEIPRTHFKNRGTEAKEPVFGARRRDGVRGVLEIRRERSKRAVAQKSASQAWGGFEMGSKLQTLSSKHLFVAGPFPEGGKLKIALKIIRKIFPYRDKCVPGKFLRSSALSPHSSASCKPCFNRQIGLCPGVCTGEITEEDYAKTIKNVRRLFEGKKSSIIRSLTADMKRYAKSQEFEKASQAKRQLFALQHIADVALISDNGNSQHTNKLENVPMRIEAFDVAHTSGKEMVGVMTVVHLSARGLSACNAHAGAQVGGSEADKSQYRMFKVRSAIAGDDVGALKEILERRLNHPEWGEPDIVVIDGGKTQLNAAQKLLTNRGVKAAIVSVVKDERHRPHHLLGDERYIHLYEAPILLANSEAHRFAISFHRRRRDKV